MRKLLLAISMLIIAVCSVVLYMFCANSASDVENFDINWHPNTYPHIDYPYLLERFPYDEVVGYVRDAETAKEIAESIWLKEYGESVKEQQPYIVLFDKIHGIWLVRGTLPEKWGMGGTAGILIRKFDGKVLAVWHDR